MYRFDILISNISHYITVFFLCVQGLSYKCFISMTYLKILESFNHLKALDTAMPDM